MTIRILAAGFAMCALCATANDIGYVERFALSDDRAEALKELIPGTEEYYYYHCLHYQHTGQFDEVDTMLKQWIKRYKYTARVEEIRNRQALLLYDQDPQRSLKHIRHRLSLLFNHQKIELEKEVRLPTALDQDRVSHATFARRAFSERRNTGYFEDSAFDFLMRAELNPDQRRHLLSRLRRPDYPGLPAMVIEDLRYKHSSGFGSHPVHRALLLEQLDACLELMPELIKNTNFINVYLSKLHPGNDVDWERDPKETDAYLRRLEAFVKQLPPVQNSLKAHVLYQRLILNEKQNIYDSDLFMEYIKLPRNVFYVNRDYLKRKEFQTAMAQLAADFRAHTLLPPIGGDEPLVRRHLMHFLKDAKTFEEYSEYIEHNYLRDLFAETKMVNGVGDMEQWYSLLTPAKVRALKERVDLEILPYNTEFIGAGDAVTVDVAIKNVRKLIVKTFEINTQGYYREHQRELTTAIDLDGLVANVEKSVEYGEIPLRRHTERFEFPQIEKPGVYVIEFIGNGISSRALVRKGRLTFTERLGSAGHIFTVYDAAGTKLNGATLWLAGHEYRADDHGEIAVPFSNRPGQQKIVVSHDGRSTLGRFNHAAELYALSAGFYAEREALLDDETCRVLVRPELTVNGVHVDIGLLEEAALTIHSTDLEGISSSKEVKGIELHNDRETVYEFKVPEGLASLAFTLRGKVQNLSGNRKMDLAASHAIQVNGIDRTEKTEDLHLRSAAGTYTLELLGKSGEPRLDRAVHLALKHRDFKRHVDVTLKTDPDGKIDLGALKDIVWIRATGPQGTGHTWHILRDRASHRPVIHGLAGEAVAIPYMGQDPEHVADVLSLLEIRGSTFARDRIGSVVISDGFIVIDDLPAGDYALFIKSENRQVTIRLTAGRREGAQLLARDRVLEQEAGSPVQITDVQTGEEALTFRVRNATAATRVHIVATRFMSDRTVYEGVGTPGARVPRTMRLRRPKSQYLSGRNIGDEYRYILDRRYAKRFPGNMLRRPSLLLNPWSLRKTDTGVARAESGEAWDMLAADEATKSSGARGGAGRDQKAVAAAEFANLDFLPSATVVLDNVLPDAKGMVEVPYKTLGGGQQVHVMVISRDSAAVRQVSLAAGEEQYRDRSLARILNPERHFTEQKNVSVARADKPFVIDDLRTSTVEVYDSLAKVYGLFSTLSGNPTLAEFGFILRWPDLKPEEKRKVYSKYACHELNLYLLRKDPEFFKTVIRPYLANKKDQTFVDHWLLGADLSRYLKPWAYQRLNTVERILLAQSLDGEAPHTARHVKDVYDLLPPDLERFNHLFKTALKAGALETAAGKLDFASLKEEADMELSANASGLVAASEDRAALVPARTAPRPAAPASRAARKAQLEAKAKQLGRKRVADLAEKQAKAGELSNLQQKANQARDKLRRSSTRQFYRKLDTTEEWVENNYYHLPIEQQVSSLVPVNAYWVDYAAFDGQGGFLSTHVAESTRSFTDMMLALGALDLAHGAGDHNAKRDGARLEITPANDVIIFHKEIREVLEPDEVQVILVSQNFFAHDDRYRHHNNERFDKFVTEEFRVARVYGCQVVLTNPTSTRRKVDVLLQIPEGALPVLNGFYTRSLHRQLEPYSTQALEYYFYFPAPGDFRHYPVHVAQNEDLIAHATPFVFNVKQRLSKIDTEAWSYVSQHGSAEQVVTFLRDKNADRVDLNLIAFRMKDEGFFREIIDLLTERHIYNDTLWSYGVLHDDVAVAREYLPHTAFADQCGLVMDSALLTLDPVERHRYQHKEYWPLVNARVYQLGKTRKILNRQFHDQYHQFLNALRYRPGLDDDDRMVAVIYLLLQDRVEEGLAFFDKIDSKQIHAGIQYDYLKAYAAFYRETPEVARKLAKPYKDHPVARWRNLFGDVLAQADEIDGEAAQVIDEEDRGQQQTRLAATAPSLELAVEGRVVTLRYQNIESCVVNFYRMDIELLFSKQPFVQEIGGQFTMIRPNESLVVKLPAKKLDHEMRLPDSLRDSNVMIAVTAAGITRMQAYYPHSLGLQMMENYGQLRVTHERTGKALPKVYVKVYARMKNGQVQFFKDGYTDLRGRFDYASLNTNEMDQVDKFSMLVISDEHGALVREASPPKM